MFMMLPPTQVTLQTPSLFRIIIASLLIMSNTSIIITANTIITTTADTSIIIMANTSLIKEDDRETGGKRTIRQRKKRKWTTEGEFSNEME